MLAKTQEKTGELIIVAGASLVGIIATILFPALGNSKNSAVLNDLVKSFASILILGIIWVAPKIFSSRRKGSSTLQSEGIVRPEGYLLSPVRVAVYGTLLFFAGTYLLSLIAGFLLGLFLFNSGIDPASDVFLSAAAPALLFGQSITAFLIGGWIGGRTAKGGFLAMVVVVVIGRLLLFASDAMLVGSAIDAAMIGYFLLLTIGIGIIGSLGFWRGARAREAGYIWHLLSKLPSDSRTAIEGLLYEEVLARVVKSSP